MRLTAVLAVTAVLAAPFADAASTKSLTLAPTQPQQDSTIVKKGAKSRLESIPQSDPALLGRTDSTPIDIMVKLGYDAVANYDGDIAGLAATNPQKTGKKLSQNKAAVDAYTRYVIAYETEVLDRINAKIPAAKVRQYFRTAYGGVAMTLPANKIDDLVAIEGVLAVQRDSVEQPVGARPR